MTEVRKSRSVARLTDQENEEVKKLFREIKNKTGKKSGDTLVRALRLYNNIIDGEIDIK